MHLRATFHLAHRVLPDSLNSNLLGRSHWRGWKRTHRRKSSMRMFGFQYTIEGPLTFNVDTLKPVSRNSPDRATAFETTILRLLHDIDDDTAVGRHVLRSLGIGSEIG